jgi:hypothetical protein
MSDTGLYIIVGILILHFLAGISFLLYKIFGTKSSDLQEKK